MEYKPTLEKSVNVPSTSCQIDFKRALKCAANLLSTRFETETGLKMLQRLSKQTLSIPSLGVQSLFINNNISSSNA